MTEELKKLGITHLKVAGGQAVAVNPYHKAELDESDKERWGSFIVIDYAKWAEIEALPSLPCAESIKDGTYPIGQFEEILQYRPKGTDYVFLDCPKDLKSASRINAFEHRSFLVLSEPVAERETPLDILKRFIKDEPEKFLQKCEEYEAKYPNEVAEKPEGESEANALKLLTALNQPEAEPVESAEEILKKYRAHEFSTEFGYDEAFIEDDVLKAMEEYASLRVAQEKAELTEKMERLRDIEHGDAYNDGVQDAIDLIG